MLLDEISEPRRGRPTKDDSERLHAKILDIALALFMEKGLSVSMETVAATAGVSKRTLYSRYPTKLKLFMGVLSGLSAEQTQPALNLPIDMPLKDALFRYGTVLFTHYSTPRIVAFLRLVEKEKERVPELERIHRAELERDQILPLKHYLDAQSADVLRDVDTFAAARTFVRDVIGEIGDAFANGPRTNAEKQAFLQHSATIIANGLLHRPEAPKP
jgi:AcrR family transcriptional regulator